MTRFREILRLSALGRVPALIAGGHIAYAAAASRFMPPPHHDSYGSFISLMNVVIFWASSNRGICD